MVGIIIPILGAFLKEANWRYDAIGFATAAAGLGTLLFQSPAGWLTDKLVPPNTFRNGGAGDRDLFCPYSVFAPHPGMG